MARDDKRARLALAGQWLRQERERRGFPKAVDFARALGVDPSLVSNYERGISEVSDDRAEQIADLLRLGIIEVRRNLGLWVPSSDELVEPEDDPELLQLIRQARQEREQGDPTLYLMLMRLQGMSDTRDDQARGGTQQAG